MVRFKKLQPYNFIKTQQIWCGWYDKTKFDPINASKLKKYGTDIVYYQKLSP